MRIRYGIGAACAALSAIALASCGVMNDGDDTGERVAAGPMALPTDGQVCVTVQRGTSGTVQDGTIWQNAPTWADSASASLSTGTSASGGVRRGVIRFDLPSTPPEVTVLSATLSVMQLYKSFPQTTVNVHAITAPWTEATAKWSVIGASFDPAPAGTFLSLSQTTGVRTVNVQPLVQSWLRGVAPNYGVMLDEPPVTSTNYRSSEHPTIVDRPKLTFCYVTCDDGVQNGDETAVDCGGSCAKQPVAEVCDGQDNDCDGAVDEGDAPGEAVSCPGPANGCGVATCQDGACVTEYVEAGTPASGQVPSDCRLSLCDGDGGLWSVDDAGDILDDGQECTLDVCDGDMPINVSLPSGEPCPGVPGWYCNDAGQCVECSEPWHCESLVCGSDGQCQPASCADGVQNGSETGVDCGGSCGATCASGAGCAAGGDCASWVCEGGACAAPTCADGVQNGGETGIDCGGGVCGGCGPLGGCVVGSDCAGGECSGSVCVPNCADGVRNGDETGVDCGGPVCATCALGQACLAAGDCDSGFCADGVCCDVACDTSCMACIQVKTGGADGTCAPIEAGEDPDDECDPEPVASCGNSTGYCDGSGACQRYAAGTVCGAQSCANGVQTGAGTCDGAGVCASGGTSSCGLYACGATACKTSCAVAADCASGATCSNGVCTTLLPNGQACTSNGQCQSGACNTFYRDQDGDGYGNASVTSRTCSTAPSGYVSNSTDCNDSSSARYPGAPEACNGADDDCDGQVDEGNPGGGASCNTGQSGICAAGTIACSGGSLTCARNNNPTPESCNGIDDNCNGSVDDGIATNIYGRDADGDGYGNPSDALYACSAPSGYVSNYSDCNDSNASINPGASEVCDVYKDENCNGEKDEGCRLGVFRALNSTTNQHLYTSAELMAALPPYHIEGTGPYYYVYFTQANPFMAPWFLCTYTSPDGVKHYRNSKNESCEGWTAMWREGYIALLPLPGTTPLYYATHPNGDHAYTTCAAERDLAVSTWGWIDQGVVGYVWTSPTGDTVNQHCPSP